MKITADWWGRYSVRAIWSVILISSLAFWGVVINSILTLFGNGFY
ncbi:hypothetical protein PJX95_05285 [Serratia rubidaea]|nr:hypothetical protein [Serratia rubidaea]MDC6117471.1 hypothetical protein [Serratia rubidaea]